MYTPAVHTSVSITPSTRRSFGVQAIETNVATLHVLQPIGQEIASMTEPEKRRYKLPQALGAMHCKSLRRLYGTQGTQVGAVTIHDW